MKKSLFIGGGLLVVSTFFYQSCDKIEGVEGGTGEAAVAARQGEVEQPIAFDHKIHIESEEMECIDCRHFAKKGRYATLPRIKDCEDCHSEPQGESEAEVRFLEYLEEDREVEWVTVNKLPGHVYFSHRAHAGYAEMKC